MEDSRKQKRRGTPNAVVLAGMSMPAPFETPVHMPKSHVLLLHQLRREIRERAGLPALKAEVKDEGALVSTSNNCVPNRFLMFVAAIQMGNNMYENERKCY